MVAHLRLPTELGFQTVEMTGFEILDYSCASWGIQEGPERGGGGGEWRGFRLGAPSVSLAVSCLFRVYSYINRNKGMDDFT